MFGQLIDAGITAISQLVLRSRGFNRFQRGVSSVCWSSQPLLWINNIDITLDLSLLLFVSTVDFVTAVELLWGQNQVTWWSWTFLRFIWWRGPRILSRSSINHVFSMELRWGLRNFSVRIERLFISKIKIGRCSWRRLLILFLILRRRRVYTRKVIVQVGQSVRYEFHAALKACPYSLVSRLLIARPTFRVKLIILTIHKRVHVPWYIDSILMPMTIYSILKISAFTLPFHQSCLLLVLTPAIEGLKLLLSLPSLRYLRVRFSVNYCGMERRRYQLTILICLGVIVWCYICSRWRNLRN